MNKGGGNLTRVYLRADNLFIVVLFVAYFQVVEVSIHGEFENVIACGELNPKNNDFHYILMFLS